MASGNLLFIHGLEGSSQGVKARMLQELFPEIQVPDFSGSLSERMEHLSVILALDQSWTIIGSSFGALMAALFTHQFPQRVDRLILLAPALVWPEFTQLPPSSIAVPTVIIHGLRDDVIPIVHVRELAERTFVKCDFRTVDDDHGLHETARKLDWKELVVG